jgi:hypothetical protein
VELAEVLRATKSNAILVERLRLFQTLPLIQSALSTVVAPAVLITHIKRWVSFNRASPYNEVPACFAAHVPEEFRSITFNMYEGNMQKSTKLWPNEGGVKKKQKKNK